jgi:hypothetical protein
MKDGNFTNRGFIKISTVICIVSILAMPQWGVCSSSVDDETGQQQLNETETPGSEELRLREDAEVKEVNDAALAEIAQAEAVKRNRYQEELGYVPTSPLLTDDELAAFEKQRAEKENAVRAKVGNEIKAVEGQPAAAPQDQTAAVPQRRLVKAASAAGTVTGIVLYAGNGAALIGGNVVRENDVVLGAKIVRITPDYVEFERHDRRWKQLVGKIPPTADWEQQGPTLKKASADPNSKSKSKPAPKTKAGK